MAVANRKETFKAQVETIWNIVTSLEDYAWRSDLDRIEVIKPGKQFLEYTKDGFSTKFTITAFEPYQYYAFDMENDNMEGHWTGIFSYRDGMTEVDFTEDVIAKKLIMRPFVKGYLRKQQALYMEDLRRAIQRL